MLRSVYVHACSCAQARVSVFVDMWHDADILCGLVWLSVQVCECVWLKRQLGLGIKAWILAHYLCPSPVTSG